MKCSDCLAVDFCLINGLRNLPGMLACEGILPEPGHIGIVEIIEAGHKDVVANVEGSTHRLRMIVDTSLQVGDKCVAVYDFDKMTIGVLCILRV